MINDPSQRVDVAGDYPDVAQNLADSLSNWENEVLSQLQTNSEDDRPYPVGHPDFLYTQLPARDGIPHGNIDRSNRFPNNTFFENWTSLDDSITWDIDILEAGTFDVELYYTARQEDIGSMIEVSFGDHKITQKVIEPNDPPLRGMENDRVERMESYVKDFKPLEMGTLELEAGRGLLTLKALEIPGEEVIDIRLLMFTRVQE